MAEVSAVILTTGGHENKTYDVTIDEAVSFQDIAALISGITGREIKYVSPEGKDYIDALVNAGVPKLTASETADCAEGISQTEFDQTSDTVERLIGRRPVYVRDYLRHIYPG